MTEFSAQLSSSTDRVPLHELNHRTNNEFAAVIGGVSLAAATSSCQAVKRFSGNIRYPDIDRNAYRYQLEKSVLSCCRTFSLPNSNPPSALPQSAPLSNKARRKLEKKEAAATQFMRRISTEPPTTESDNESIRLTSLRNAPRYGIHAVRNDAHRSRSNRPSEFSCSDLVAMFSM